MNQEFSPVDSLNVIRSMIDKTKADLSKNSKYFLLWGWAAFLACITQFILKVLFNYPHHYMVWLITIVCAVISMFMSIGDSKHKKVSTYVGESMRYLWTGLGISFFIISVILFKVGFKYGFPFYILLYGIGTFISGMLLKYKPFKVGGIICFILAAASPWFLYDYQILSAALALFFSYILPGHLLRAKYNRNADLVKTNHASQIKPVI